MLQKNDLLAMAEDFVANCPQNRINEEQALRPDLVGLRIWDSPIMAVASSEDALFADLCRPEVIGEHFRLPKEWLPGAKTVISYFFPFSEAVRKPNRADPGWPALEWLHGRIEGQLVIEAWNAHLSKVIEQTGFKAVVPIFAEEFRIRRQEAEPDGKPSMPNFSSNWSERHVAYVCGLGTFGLSAGLITSKGIAGRFGSLVTDMPIEPDTRPYTSHTEYCTRCGECIQKCPVKAISLEKGKEHPICAPFLAKTKNVHAPRYGCGKCQVAVPCERRIPPRRKTGPSGGLQSEA